VVVSGFPGVATARGLTVYMPEVAVVERYGLPDFAFEIRRGTDSIHELIYLDAGLLVVLRELRGQPDRTVTDLLLTFPVNLRVAVAARERAARTPGTVLVTDLTHAYRVWAQLALSAQ